MDRQTDRQDSTILRLREILRRFSELFVYSSSTHSALKVRPFFVVFRDLCVCAFVSACVCYALAVSYCRCIRIHCCMIRSLRNDTVWNTEMN